ncbi:MAG: DNA-binding response regulator [Chloroflexi bacterium]|nr:MAG: DNA-binding response regulator [Chloroflexota bacterium]
MPIRILVADDHPIVREGLVAVLSTQPDFEVVAEAETGVEALQRFESLHPDVVLLDLQMPELDGVQTLERLLVLEPDARVIAFTAFDTDERIVQAVRAGARGYLLKGAPREEIFSAIRVVHGGGALLQPIVAARLLRRVAGDESPSHSLTEREFEVLRLLARGKLNKEIAGELAITERTVKFHVSAILGKLGAGNRTEAVRIAAQHGLIDLS